MRLMMMALSLWLFGFSAAFSQDQADTDQPWRLARITAIDPDPDKADEVAYALYMPENGSQPVVAFLCRSVGLSLNVALEGADLGSFILNRFRSARFKQVELHRSGERIWRGRSVYVWKRGVLVLGSDTPARQTYNAVLRGVDVAIRQDNRDLVTVDLPEANDQFVTFSEACRDIGSL
jgi:hypothetical protein